MNVTLKNSFETLKDYKNDIQNVLLYINNKLILLVDMYNNYLKEITDKINYKISLDTFNFQTKLIKIEHDNYNKMFNIFLNRIYGDYYKLYRKLVDYVNTNVKEVKIINNNEYPKYKDLDTSTQYSFDIIENIYLEMLSIISELSNYCLKEEHLIKEIEKKQENGINIHNFLNEKKYSIIILQQKINFFYDIINGYITFQLKFYKRLYLKLKLIYAQLCSDINLETSISKNKKMNIIDSPSSDEDIHKVDSFSSSENMFELNLENELNKKISQFNKIDQKDEIDKHPIIINYENEQNNENAENNENEENEENNENEESAENHENEENNENAENNGSKKKKKKKKKKNLDNLDPNIKIFDNEQMVIVSSSSNESDNTLLSINLE